MSVRVLIGDVRERLKDLADESVHCVVTSPPYFGLRDYGSATWEGGDETCDHRKVSPGTAAISKSTLGPNRDGVSGQATNGHQQEGFRSVCGKCGARRIDKQIGLEATPDAYVAEMVAVFREVRRVLRKDGTVWLNLGDSYNNRTKVRTTSHQPALNGFLDDNWAERAARGGVRMSRNDGDLKEKDLIGVPWMVAFALRADGWYLRQDIIWSKPNPMPESVRDRCTKAHEYLFLFAKGQHNTRTIKFANLTPETIHFGRHLGAQNSYSGTARLCVELATSIFNAAQAEHDSSLPPFYSQVWQESEGGSGSALVANLPPNHRAPAHAARFLSGNATTKEFLCEINRLWRDLTERDHLLVGNRLAEGALTPAIAINRDGAVTVDDAGQVSKIDFAHGHIVVTVPTDCKYFYDAGAIAETAVQSSGGWQSRAREGVSTLGNGLRNSDRADGGECVGPNRAGSERNRRSVWTITTQPFAEAHFATFPPELPELCIKAGCPVGGAVLDPFGGAGTTGMVADRLGRDAILIELNPEYAALAERRIYGDGGMFVQVAAE